MKMHTLVLALVATGLLALVRPLFTFEGSAEGGRFGASVAGAGDVDGDGYPDVVVGAPHVDGVGSSSGEVRAFSGWDGELLWVVAGDAAGDWFGFSVDGAGDVDGDGTRDVVVGSPLGTPPEGSAYVLSGLTGAVLWAWAGDAPGDRFGHAVCGAGDVNADGVPDVTVGAPLADGAGTFAGRVRVFSGADGSVLHTFDGSAWDQCGSSVGAAGDVDGDGWDDMVVGAPLADGSAFNSGTATVYSGATGASLHVWHGAVAGDRFGSVVRGAGDVDGDGTPDLLIGIPAADVIAFDSGAVEVRSGKDGALLLAVSGTKAGEFMQVGAGVGDVDRDGCADVLVGSPSADGIGPEAGLVRLFSGQTGLELQAFRGRSALDWFGAAVAGAGDVNRDGRLDLLVGAPGHDDEPEKHGYAQILWTIDDARHTDPRTKRRPESLRR
jgi:hypothetical protein